MPSWPAPSNPARSRLAARPRSRRAIATSASAPSSAATAGSGSLNRDGSFNVARDRDWACFETLRAVPPAADHLVGRFPRRGRALTYLVLNLVFALAYLACGPDALARPGRDDARRPVQPGVLLQHPDVRDDRLRPDRPERVRRQHRRHGRGARRPDVSGARDGAALRAVHAADRLDPLQPTAPSSRRTADGQALMFRIVNRRRERNHRARGAGAVQRARAGRPRRHRAPLLAAAARAEQGDVLSAVVDDRASD